MLHRRGRATLIANAADPAAAVLVVLVSLVGAPVWAVGLILVTLVAVTASGGQRATA